MGYRSEPVETLERAGWQLLRSAQWHGGPRPAKVHHRRDPRVADPTRLNRRHATTISRIVAGSRSIDHLGRVETMVPSYPIFALQHTLLCNEIHLPADQSTKFFLHV